MKLVNYIYDVFYTCRDVVLSPRAHEYIYLILCPPLSASSPRAVTCICECSFDLDIIFDFIRS